MRIRSIKPEFWRSDDIAALSWEDRLLFIGLWSYVDDNGVGRDEERIITADLFALDDSFSESSLRVHDGLARLQTANLIERYEVDGRRFLHITTWSKHQKINRPSPGRYPLPTCENATIHDSLTEDSLSPHNILRAGTGEQGNRGTGEQGKEMATRKRVAPTAGTRLPDTFTVTPDMAAWATEHAPGVDTTRATEKFIDYWHSQPGAKGRKTDWTATWRNWIRNDQDRATPNRRTPTTTDRMRGWETAAASLQPSLPRIGA